MAAQNQIRRLSSIQIGVTRRSPSSIGVGIIFRNSHDATLRKIGYVTNEDDLDIATYDAVIHALENAAPPRALRVTVYLDNATIVDQLNRKIKVIPDLMDRFIMARCQANSIGRVQFELSKPRHGFAARRLANAVGLDRQPVNTTVETPALQLNFGD